MKPDSERVSIRSQLSADTSHRNVLHRASRICTPEEDGVESSKQGQGEDSASSLHLFPGMGLTT